MKLRLAVVVAFATGFVALSYEILWYRTFAFVTAGTSSVFALLLGFYLMGIAFGSSRARLLVRGADADRSVYVVRLAWLVLVANVASALVVPGLALLASALDFRPAFFLVSLGAGLMGATLPVLSHVGIEPDARAGFELSLVYVGNIAGSALGTVLTGFVLTDVLSTTELSLVLAGAGFAAAVLATVLAGGAAPARARLRIAGAGALALAALVVGRGPLYGSVYERLLYKKHVARHAPFALVVENRHGLVCVTSDRLVFGGGTYDGAINVSLDDDTNLPHRAYAVGAMRSKHPDAPRDRDVLMVGLSSGSWAQIVANLPTTRSLTIVEINPGYLELVRRYDVVRPLLSDPKVKIEIDDARRWLRRHPDAKFDFVVANMTFYWRAHATNLLSVEFLDLVRAHLRPWGIHYYNTTSSVDVLRTAVTAFPHALRVVNFVAVSDVPFDFDGDAFSGLVETMRIAGAPVLSRADRRDWLVRFASSIDDPNDPSASNRIERRESIVARIGTGNPITDDNMLAETREPLWFPALE